MGMGEKKNKQTPKYKKRKQGKNSLFGYPPIHRLRNGDRLFSGARKHRKQAGPTLKGRGFLI